jgi:hypothetical protein
LLQINLNTEEEFIAAFGQVAFLAHVIEDLLRLHVFEAGRFEVAGIVNRTVEQVQQLKFPCVIDDFRYLHPEQAALADALDSLQKVRNTMFHAFCPDVGGDLVTSEGQDQIHALLLKIALLQRRHLKSLQKLHEELLHTIYHGRTDDLLTNLFTDDWNVKTVAKSDLLKFVEKLEQK